MGPIELFKLMNDYRKANAILKEKTVTASKITQIGTLLVSVIGLLGVSTMAQSWASAHPTVLAVLGVLAAALGHLFPAIFATPPATPGVKASVNTSLKGLAVLLVFGLMAFPVHAQTVATVQGSDAKPAAAAAPASTEIQNLYGAGVSYNPGASPSIAGTALYARYLAGSGAGSTYAFTAVDALPESVKPFTMTTNIGVGVAEQVATLDGVPIFIPTAAGISWSGSDTGWQWNGGVIAVIHLKNSYYLLPSVRFLKSSVSGGSGYQPIVGVAFGFGQ